MHTESIENRNMCFIDIKIMSQANGGDSVKNKSTGLVVYRTNTIPDQMT